MENESCLNRIIAKSESQNATVTERKIALYIKENLEKVLHCNLLELADVRETGSLLRRQTPPDAARREKGALAARLLQEAAAANGICLKLNRKKK